METEKDKALWRQAKKRVGFKRHLATYLIINGMFWCIWWFAEKEADADADFPWPVWPMLGWGIGLAFDFMGAYLQTGNTAVEREYEKLKNKS